MGEHYDHGSGTERLPGFLNGPRAHAPDLVFEESELVFEGLTY